MTMAMQYGGWAMQFEHVSEIATHILDRFPFMLEIVKKLFHNNVRIEKEKK